MYYTKIHIESAHILVLELLYQASTYLYIKCVFNTLVFIAIAHQPCYPIIHNTCGMICYVGVHNLPADWWTGKICRIRTYVGYAHTATRNNRMCTCRIRTKAQEGHKGQMRIVLKYE